jgi:hypothetical protein
VPALVQFANVGKTTLAVDINAVQTTIEVANADSFPDLNTAIGEIFYLALESIESGAIEVCTVTDIDKGTKLLTVVRGVGGTVSVPFVTGDLAENRVTKSTLEAFVQRTEDFGGGGGSSRIPVSETPPTNPEEGDQWYDSATGLVGVWVVGTNPAWVSDALLLNPE